MSCAHPPPTSRMRVSGPMRWTSIATRRDVDTSSAAATHGVPAEPLNNVKPVPSRSSVEMRRRRVGPIVRHPGSGFPAQFLGVDELHGIGVGGSGLVGHHRSGAVLVTGNHVKRGPFSSAGSVGPLSPKGRNEAPGPVSDCPREATDGVPLDMICVKKSRPRRPVQYRCEFPRQVVRTLDRGVGPAPLSGGIVCAESPTRNIRPQRNWSATCS